MNKIELKDIVGGALQEKFSKAFERVIENLQDPNTSFKVKRGITIKMDFVQNEQRDDVSVSVQVAEKLAPQAPMATAFQIGKDLKTGELYAEEYGKAIRGQITVDELPKIQDEKQPNYKVDLETGEILNHQEDAGEEETAVSAVTAVIDLRKARQ